MEPQGDIHASVEWRHRQQTNTRVRSEEDPNTPTRRSEFDTCGGLRWLAGAKQSAVVRDHEGELAWAVELETNLRQV